MSKTDVKKLAERTKGKIPYRYDLALNEIYQLAEMLDKDFCLALTRAFQIGFLRGVRAKSKDPKLTL